MNGSFLKQYPLSGLVTCAIIYLSLMPVPETELEDVPLIDKWAHLCMYGGLSGLVWLEYLRAHETIRRWELVLRAVIFPILLSGCMELAQAYCTTYRSGDWLDMIANSLGVALGALFGWALLKYRAKKRK